MIFTWMAYAMVCAALCAVIGASADVVLRAWLRQRRAIWIASMLASIVLPLAMPLLLPSSEPVPSAPATGVAVGVRERALVVPFTPEPRIDWGQLALLLWMSTSALLSGSLIVSSTQLRRRLHGYRKAKIDGQSLLVSDDFGPAVVGLLHPTIVLPAWALRLTESERHLVVSHELEHQRARDPVVTIGALLVVALFPWNIALWWQLSRLRLAIEFDCDARVVARAGADPFAYGNLLLTAHENAGQTRLAVLALAPIRSALGQRINALVGRSAQSTRRTIGAFGIAVLALSAVGFAPVPQLPQAALRTFAAVPSLKQPVAESPAASQSTLRLQETPSQLLSANSLPVNAISRAPRVKEPRQAARQPNEGTYSMTSPSATLRDEPNNVVVLASPQRPTNSRQQSPADSAPINTLTAAPRLASQQTSAPASSDSVANASSARGGSFGTMGTAVMRPREDAAPVRLGGVGGTVQRSAAGTMIVNAVGGGGRSGQLTNSPPLKTYTGGFMNAEVPARPDSARPPIR